MGPLIFSNSPFRSVASLESCLYVQSIRAELTSPPEGPFEDELPELEGDLRLQILQFTIKAPAAEISFVRFSGFLSLYLMLL